MELTHSASRSRARRVPADRYALAALMAIMGVLHFVLTKTFASMMPVELPSHTALVLVSGAFEVGLSIALLVPRTRVLAAYALIALFVAIFPANISMALHPERALVGVPVQAPALLLWLRLPLQFALMAWAYKHARARD